MAKRNAKKKPVGAAQRSRRSTKREPAAPAVKLLSGGNPQIGKGDGDAPVAAYIAAMPGWKHDVGAKLDALVAETVPGVAKAVRWNSPFWGVPGQGWFMALHCITKYVKVTFFRGTSLDPLPPEGSKVPNVRYVHLFEDEPLDEELLRAWIRQAAALPGEHCF
jgi:hypothetical protein